MKLYGLAPIVADRESFELHCFVDNHTVRVPFHSRTIPHVVFYLKKSYIIDSLIRENEGWEFDLPFA